MGILSEFVRVGWSLKEAASVLDIKPQHVSQALDPALIKVALLMRANPLATLEAIMDQMSRLPPINENHSLSESR